MTAQPIPPGFHALAPHLAVAGGGEAIAFYTRAFGAQLLEQKTRPDGRTVAHAMMRAEAFA